MRSRSLPSDPLDVNAVLGEQKIARFVAAFRIADEDRHDMCRARHHRQRGSSQNARVRAPGS